MKWIGFVVVLVCVVGLVAVRAFEHQWFYDPMLAYFKLSNPTLPVPKYDAWRLVFHHIFRFVMNSIFSLGLIWGLYKNISYLKISTIIIGLSFILCFPFYYYMLETDLEYGYQLTFYLRRFVIQPMPLLLLVPLFYYLRRK